MSSYRKSIVEKNIPDRQVTSGIFKIHLLPDEILIRLYCIYNSFFQEQTLHVNAVGDRVDLYAGSQNYGFTIFQNGHVEPYQKSKQVISETHTDQIFSILEENDINLG